MQKLIKIISKMSIFSLLGVIMSGWLSYIFLKLWLHPQASDIELIYSLTILVIFEFILVHSGVFMSILGRSWKGWLGFIIIYGIFALAFNTLVNGNQIIILYGAVVFNRMLPGILNSGKAGKEQELAMSAVYAMIYFFLLLAVIFGASYIPRWGLTEAFLNSADYGSINQAGGVFEDAPHVFMCFGVLYYLILMFVEVNSEIHRIKASLLPSTDSGQVINEQEIENEQTNPTIFHQFGKDDGKQMQGCGCSPWLVFVLAAALMAIGVYQLIDNAKLNNNGVFTSGIISEMLKSVTNDKKTEYLVSVTFTAEGKEYTFTAQDYISDVKYGDTLSVVYPPNHPEKAIVAGTKIRQEGGNIFIWLGIIIIFALTVLMLIGKKIQKGIKVSKK